MTNRRATGIVLGIFATIAFASSTLAVTFNVDSDSYNSDVTPGDGACATSGGTCTLLAAIQEADALPGDDVINLPSGTYDRTAPCTGTPNRVHLFVIDSNLTIVGAGASTTILDGGGTCGVLRINTGTVEIFGVQIANGYQDNFNDTFTLGVGLLNVGNTSLSDVEIRSNTGAATGTGCAYGGGVANFGTLSLDRVLVTDNQASIGGGVRGSFTAVESQIVANRAVGSSGCGAFGGGIYNPSGSVSLTDTTVDGNIADTGSSGSGGGFYSTGTVVLERSSVTNNQAWVAAGFFNSRGTLSAVNSTFSGNSTFAGATFGVSGVLNLASSGSAATLELSNCTVTQNSDSAGNSVIANYDNDNASPATVRFKNTIVASNPGSQMCRAVGANQTLISLDYNLASDSTCGLSNGHDVQNFSPAPLDPLADYGGPTLTHRVQSTANPVLDAIPAPSCTTIAGAVVGLDQRGALRPANGACERGSYEVAPLCGDGITDSGESCDDGNLIDGDGCDSNCSPTGCGNGVVTAGEQCDDGNMVSGDLCSSTCQVESCLAPPSGMVAWWPFDGAGTDVTGNGRDATLTGAATYATGKVGQALSVAALGDRADAAHDAAWNFGTGDFTIDLWLKLNSLRDPSPILSHELDDGNWPWVFHWFSGNLSFDITYGPNGPGPLIARPWSPVAGTWYHVALTRTGNTWEIYVDGASIGANIEPANISGTMTTLNIAGRTNGPFPIWLDGMVDELEIFNRALSPAEIQLLYAAGSGGKCKCGTGTIESGEDCDDAGESATCDADCTFVTCGDGTLNATAGEACDDGNTTGGDGCDASCAIEAGYECPTPGAPCNDIDGCTSDPCASGGACADVPAPGTGFTCDCSGTVWGMTQCPACGITQLTASTGGFATGPAVSGDGTTVVFYSDRDWTPGAPGNADNNNEIFTLDLTTGTITQITNTTGGVFTGAPDINGDGTRIVFETDLDLVGSNGDNNREIYLYDTTSGLSQITVTTGGGCCAANGNAQIDSVGTRIVFQSYLDVTPGSPGNADGNEEVFLYDTTTGTFTQITDGTGANNGGARISGDGAWLGVRAVDDPLGTNADGNPEAFLYEIATGTFTQITDSTGGSNSQPELSYDGSIAVIGSNRDLTPGSPGNADLNTEGYVYERLTATLTQLTDTTVGNAGNPRISGNGQQVVLRMDADWVPGTPGNADNGEELYKYDRGSMTWTQLTASTGGGSTSTPSLSDDGSVIVFRSDRDHDNPPGNSDGSLELFAVECGAICGDSTIDPGEDCDDGNALDGDCCSSTCQIEAAGTVCRAAADLCDVAETCDGVSDSCPTDAFESAGTSCRSAAGACDVEEVCDGVGAACPADAKSTAECRAAADLCDVAESCDGVSNDCPADAAASAGTTCRAAAGVCDAIELCDGASTACPADAKSTAECRADAGQCDVAESCDGVSNDCPADAFEPDATTCDDGDPLTTGDQCTAGICAGLSSCGDGVKDPGEECDDSNTTNGDGCSSACLVEPCVTNANGLIAWWTGDNTTYDLTGNGYDGTLQNGATYAAGQEGQAFDVSGTDDHVEVPDDPAWAFPGELTIHLWANANGFGPDPNSLLVQSEGGGESNKWMFWIAGNGTGLEFHINGPAPYPVGGYVIPGPFSFSTGTWYHLAVTRDGGGTYRTYVNGNEVGSGTAGHPIPDIADSLRIGHSSASLANITFNGLIDEVQIHDVALSQPELADIYANGTGESCWVCGDGQVDLGEDCDSTPCCDGSCQFEVNGTPCDDDNQCSSTDTCDGAGTCVGSGKPSGCLDTFEKGVLLIKENKSGKEKFIAKLIKGPAATQTDFGNPLDPGGTSYSVCVFNEAETLVGQMDIDRAGDSCDGKPCFKAKGGDPPDGKGYLYKDKSTSSDGIKLLLMKGGDAGKTKLLAKGFNKESKGQTSLPTGIAAGVNGSANVTVQLHSSDGGQCYELSYGDVKKDTGDFFKAKK